MEEHKRHYSSLCVVSLVFALCFFVPFLPFLGFLLALIALGAIDPEKYRGRNLASYAVVFGLIITLVQIIFAFYLYQAFYVSAKIMVDADKQTEGLDLADSFQYCYDTYSQESLFTSKKGACSYAVILRMNKEADLTEDMCTDSAVTKSQLNSCVGFVKEDKSYCWKLSSYLEREFCVKLIEEKKAKS